MKNRTKEHKHRDFYIKDKSPSQLCEEINKEFPINLAHNKDYIDRIHDKNPLYSKEEIARVVISFFTCWRELLILGTEINFFELFMHNKLFFFRKRGRSGIDVMTKIRIMAPPILKD